MQEVIAMRCLSGMGVRVRPPVPPRSEDEPVGTGLFWATADEIVVILCQVEELVPDPMLFLLRQREALCCRGDWRFVDRAVLEACIDRLVYDLEGDHEVRLANRRDCRP